MKIEGCYKRDKSLDSRNGEDLDGDFGKAEMATRGFGALMRQL